MPATEFAPCHHFAQCWQCDSQETGNTTCRKCCACHILPRKMTSEVSKVLPLRRKMQRIVWKRRETIFSCHTKRLLISRETCWNVTKCHAKWSYVTLESSKSDPFCRTYYRHGHMALTRTVVDGCERRRTVAQRLANTAQPPHTQSETGTLATHSGKTLMFSPSFSFSSYLVLIFVSKCIAEKSEVEGSLTYSESHSIFGWHHATIFWVCDFAFFGHETPVGFKKSSVFAGWYKKKMDAPHDKEPSRTAFRVWTICLSEVYVGMKSSIPIRDNNTSIALACWKMPLL